MPTPKRPRCAKKNVIPAESATSSDGISEAPTPGPSGIQSRPLTLAEDIKVARASKVKDLKNLAKLDADQRRRLADLKMLKQVGSFILPDAPESRKGKGKGQGKNAQPNTISCPLIPGVPVVPPAKIPRPWEVLHSLEHTMEEKRSGDSSPDFVEGTPPKMGEVETSRPWLKRKIDFSPSLGVVQATESPVTDPVWADIELVGFTPQSSTSRAIPGSGTSAMSYETERDFPEPEDSASEVEVEGEPVNDACQERDVHRYPAIDDIEDPGLAQHVQHLSRQEDASLRTIAQENSLIDFDWRSDPENFEGTREIFTGPSGPTFEVAGMTPLQVFQTIFDANIIDHIVHETNRYAEQVRSKSLHFSRMVRWTDTTPEEMWRFFTILFLQSMVVNNVEREYWYPKLEQMKVGNYGQIMSFNRFVLLKRCLYFTDNNALPPRPSKLDKVLPVLTYLNHKFSSLYLPEQNVAIDESLLLWKGRLSFAQQISRKRARVGIKSYELCESRTGYLWSMEVYSGKKGSQEAIDGHALPNEPESATSQIVFRLMRPLFNRGHTLIMDNFYNSPLLSRILKRIHHTDSMGTLRLNREFVPDSLKGLKKQNMRTGEVCFSTTKDLGVVVWKDKSVVSLISTFHKLEVGGKEKFGYYKYKPTVVLDYNLFMGGVDHKDQMLYAYPIERGKNVCWFKKLFRRLLNVSVHNAFIIYNHGRTQNPVAHREFRVQLVQEMLQTYCSPPVITQTPRQSILPSDLHLPAKNDKAQRCKLCHSANVRRTTTWKCSTCHVNLCMPGCYTEYHIKFVCRT